MMSDLQELFKKKIIPVTFERTIGLFGATTIGVGALMGAGIYVLIGLAANVAGPSVWISYAACGILAFLSALLYAQLAKLVPATGGGYAYAFNSLGSLGGFTTGWFLALGSIFACGLYAIGFAEYLSSMLWFDVPDAGTKAIAILLVVSSTLLNTRGTKSGEKIQKILTWGNILILMVLALSSLPYLETGNIKPMFPQGVEGTGSAIAIIYISFFGYQLIANNSDEIKSPTTTVPKAMVLAMGISLVVYLTISVIAVMVVPWQQLAASNAPLVEVASKGLGRYGWLFISVGAIIASAGAFNSTLLSQGRQIFAMGKDQFLPNKLGTIHEEKKTPVAALYTGGVFIAIALIFLDLEFIAKSANFCLLVSMLPVSLALRKIYRSDPEKTPKFLWKRILPEITLLVNTGLLFTLDWISLGFGFYLGIIGFLVYFLYSRKRAVRGKIGMNLVLTSEPKKNFSWAMDRIMVPIANPTTLKAICSISNSMFTAQGGELVPLSVVKTPEQIDFYSALAEADYSLELVQMASEIPKKSRVSVRPVIRASHSLPKGIVHAAEEEGCNLIIMGYAGSNSKKSTDLIKEVLLHSHTDMIFFRFHDLDKTFPPRKVAVPVSSPINLPLILRLADALSNSYNCEIHLLTILPLNFKPQQKQHTKKLISTIRKEPGRRRYKFNIFSSDNPLELLVEKSTQYDLLIVGTREVKLWEGAVVGRFSTQVAERAACSVAVVRKVSAPKKIIKTVQDVVVNILP